MSFLFLLLILASHALDVVESSKGFGRSSSSTFSVTSSSQQQQLRNLKDCPHKRNWLYPSHDSSSSLASTFFGQQRQCRGGSQDTATVESEEYISSDITTKEDEDDEEQTSTTTKPDGVKGEKEELKEEEEKEEIIYGRLSDDEYRLTPDQIATFHREGCVTIENVLQEDEVAGIADVFDMFLMGYVPVPGKDFCDMSKPYGIPHAQWSIVNCMLPTRYYPAWQNNVYERLTRSMAKQFFPDSDMVKDYDQLLNKRPGKDDAVFAWHQDMGYWPGAKALGVEKTDTCTFSLAVDDSDEANGCLRYVSGSGTSKQLRPHRPLVGGSRDEGHALTVEVDMEKDDVRLAPAKRGSITIHDEYVVHGSSGNTCAWRQRRTYVLAYRAKEIVTAERKIGFTHSHNDEVNWDTFDDGESHRVASGKNDNLEDGASSNVEKEVAVNQEDEGGIDIDASVAAEDEEQQLDATEMENSLSIEEATEMNDADTDNFIEEAILDISTEDTVDAEDIALDDKNEVPITEETPSVSQAQEEDLSENQEVSVEVEIEEEVSEYSAVNPVDDAVLEIPEQEENNKVADTPQELSEEAIVESTDNEMLTSAQTELQSEEVVEVADIAPEAPKEEIVESNDNGNANEESQPEKVEDIDDSIEENSLRPKEVNMESNKADVQSSSNTKEEENQSEDEEVGPSVNEEVGPSVNEEVGPSVNEVGPSVNEEVGPSVNEEVAPSVNEEVGPSVNEEVGPSVNEEVGPSVNEEVGPLVNEEVGPSVNEEVGPLVNEEVGPSVNEESSEKPNKANMEAISSYAASFASSKDIKKQTEETKTES